MTTPWQIPWKALDTTKPLIPLPPQFPRLSQEERLAVSQYFGLAVISAIAQHEDILGGIEFPARLDQFLREEANHSAAFGRYISEFAAAARLSPPELFSVLPRLTRRSWFTRIFLLSHATGGLAIWHLVQSTELESIDLYRYLAESREDVEPAYLELNRLHYEEEIRHINVPAQFTKLSKSRCSRRFAKLLHFVWAVLELRRVGRAHALAGRHPFFAHLSQALRKTGWRARYRLVCGMHTYLTGDRRLRTLLRAV